MTSITNSTEDYQDTPRYTEGEVNGIHWMTDEIQYEDEPTCYPYPEIRSEDKVIECEDAEVLAIWFFNLAKERMGDKEARIDPAATTLTMPITADDLRGFADDCDALADYYDNGCEGFPPSRFQGGVDGRSEWLIDECSNCGICIVDIADKVRALLDESEEPDFTFYSHQDDYDNWLFNTEPLDDDEDEVADGDEPVHPNITATVNPDGTTDYTLTLTLEHYVIEECLEEVKGGMTHAEEFATGVFRAIADLSLDEELRYFCEEFADKYGWSYDD